MIDGMTCYNMAIPNQAITAQRCCIAQETVQIQCRDNRKYSDFYTKAIAQRNEVNHELTFQQFVSL